MTDRREHELSRAYREGAWPESRRQIDEAILRAARARRSFARRWALPVALAAAAALAFTLSEKTPEYRMFSLLSRDLRPAPAVRQPPVPTAPEPKTEFAPALGREAPELAIRRSEGEPLRLQGGRALPDTAAGAARASEAARAERAQELPPSPRTPEPASAAPVASTGVQSDIRSAALGRSPQAWLEDIRKLKAESKAEEAEREFAEFRKRYPEYPLPEDLRL